VSGLPTTLPAAWAERWEHEPDRAQLHEPTSGWHTRGALDAASRAAAGRLYGLGIRKGDRVLLSATASVDLVVAHVACLRLGAIVVPVNGAYRRPEVAHVVTDATPRLAITDHPDWPGWLAAVDARVAITTPDVPAAAAAAPSLDQVDAGDAALVGYTSGTTGAPCCRTPTSWPAPTPSSAPGSGPPPTASCSPCPCSTCTASGWGCMARC
jgi:acyl-CoA synthetase (AMP-forming)/AMP-acid ligase II